MGYKTIFVIVIVMSCEISVNGPKEMLCTHF